MEGEGSETEGCKLHQFCFCADSIDYETSPLYESNQIMGHPISSIKHQFCERVLGYTEETLLLLKY